MLILQVGTASKEIRTSLGDYPEWFCQALKRSVDTVEVVKVFEGEEIPPADPNRPVIITGSGAMVTDYHPWSARAAQWIRGAMEIGTPLFGVCYGHQLMADALGGRVGFHPKGREVGCQKIHLSDIAIADPFLKNLPLTFSAHLLHEQTILEMPQGAKALAYSSHDPYQIVRYGPRALSTQFHPEFTVDINSAYLKRQAAVLHQEGRKLDDLLDQLEDTPQARQILTDFIEAAMQGVSTVQ